MRKIINILKRKRFYNEKENVLIRILYLNGFNDNVTIMLGCFSASAATTTSSGSYVLSKTDQTEKKHTKSLSVSGGGSATVTAQHWKGSTFPTYSDTAYSKINSSSSLKSTSVAVYIYKTNGDLAASGSSSNYVNKEAGYGTTVDSTKHIFTLSNNSNTLIYNVVGTQS